MAKPLFPENRQHGAGDIHHTPKVRIDLAFEFIGCHFFERADETITRIVDDHIDPAKRLLGCGYSSLRFGWRCNIESNGSNPITISFNEISQLLWFTGRGHDQMPGFQNHFG
jgi:hypothetical protein